MQALATDNPTHANPTTNEVTCVFTSGIIKSGANESSDEPETYAHLL